MAFGFIIARFGLFLSLVTSAQNAVHTSDSSLYIGAALVVIGSAAIAAGTLQYQRYCKSLRPQDLPSLHATRLPQTLAWLLVVAGVGLVFVLLT